MTTSNLEHIRESMRNAQDHESWFWARMAQLGIPDGTAWETLREVIAGFQTGANHVDPWSIAAERLARGK